MKIIHAADLHLDSPLNGLANYSGAPVLDVRSATRKALVALVDLCLAEEVALLLIAGDLYDGDFKDYSTALFFNAQMTRLREGDVQVAWVRGNHDAANRLTKHLRTADHVHEFSVGAPETRVYDKLGIAVHGQGYISRDVRDNLAASYPAPLSGLLNIGLLHTALDGREGHAPYAPCTTAELVARGYDYWALGHVHQREVMHERPWVIFPGNLQGRHIKETGPKGATLINVANESIVSIEPCVLDQVRWERCEVHLGEARNLDDVMFAVEEQLRRLRFDAGERVLATRVQLLGRTDAHGSLCSSVDRIVAELRAIANELGDVYLESVDFSTESPLSRSEMERRKDALGDLFRDVLAVQSDPNEARALWQELRSSLNPSAAELLESSEISRDEILTAARRMLEGRLLSAPEES